MPPRSKASKVKRKSTKSVDLTEALLLHAQKKLAHLRASEARVILEAARVTMAEDARAAQSVRAAVFGNLAMTYAQLGDRKQAAINAAQAWQLGLKDHNIYQHWVLADPLAAPEPPAQPAAKPEEGAVWANAEAFRHMARGNQEAAWEALGVQNALRRRACGMAPDMDSRAWREVFEKAVQAYLDVFTESTLQEHALAVTDRTPTIVHIMGVPRTGSTMVEQILSAHPRCASAGEDVGEYNRFTSEVLTKANLSREEFLREGQTWLQSSMLTRAQAYTPGFTQVVVDKTLTMWASWGVLDMLFSPIGIVLARDPFDIAVSIWTQDFRDPALWWATDWDDIFWFIRLMYRITLAWARRMRALYRPLAIFHYNDFVNDTPEAQQATVDMLLAAVGLSADPACYHPERVDRAVYTASNYQVRSPISSDPAGRWRRWQGVPQFDALIENYESVFNEYMAWSKAMNEVCTPI